MSFRIPSEHTLTMVYKWLKGCKHAKAMYVPPESARFLTNWLTDTEKRLCKKRKGKLPWVTWNSAWKAMLVDYEYTLSMNMKTLNKETS